MVSCSPFRARCYNQAQDRAANGAHILEIGCGTGYNLAMLGGFDHVDAIEMEESARAAAAKRLGRTVFDAPLPSLDGVEEGSYHLVALLDVLEHIEDDRAVLEGIARRVVRGGRILIAVPAHPWLCSSHDVANHHWRRYTRKTLRAAITDAGLTIDYMTAINTMHFPLAVISRLTDKLRSNEVLTTPCRQHRSIGPLKRSLRRRLSSLDDFRCRSESR